MKLLQNKSTGEIGCLVCSFGKTPEKITVVEYIDGKRGSKVWYYNSLTELNKDWEDYEEPKDVWWLDNEGNVNHASRIDDCCFEKNKQIGNYFETKEEAKKAVEKLKAWKRLKDRGFMCIYHEKGLHFKAEFDIVDKPLLDAGLQKDLDLLFGGEE